jgi:peroxiredoxin
MNQIKVSVYTGGSIKQINLEDLLLNQRVLFFSIVWLRDKVTVKYIEFMLEQENILKELGVDAVYAINSSFGIWPFIQYEKQFPNLKIICDTDQKFVEFIKQQLNKNQDVEQLSKFWNYQILLNNSKIEKFYEQPTENHFKNLIMNHGLDREIIPFIKKYKDSDESMIFLAPWLNSFGLSFEMKRKLLFYNLWPNKKLLDYLNQHSVLDHK